MLTETHAAPEFDEAVAPRRAELHETLHRSLAAGHAAPWFASDAVFGHALEEAVEDETAWGLLLDRECPDAVLVLHENNFWSRTLCAAAASRRTPLFSFQEGTFYDAFAPSLLTEHGRFADRVFLWGEADRLKLVAGGADPTRLVVTGPPHLDAAVADTDARERTRRTIGLSEKDRLVLLAAPNLAVTGIPIGFQLALLDRLAGASHVHLLVKWRPTEAHEDRARLEVGARTALGARFRASDAPDPYPLVAAADVVVGAASTLAAEAVALGAPFLELAWEGDSDDVVNLSRHAGVPVLRGPGDLERIDAFAAGRIPAEILDGMRRYRDEWFGGLRGDATRRCRDGIVAALRG